MSKIRNKSEGFALSFFEYARHAGPTCRLRFAPTPSGYLHLGNALNFSLNWLVARLNGGKIFLRIDDLDAARKRPEYLTDIFESLHWLGLDWDEGPGLVANSDVLHDFEENWSQHRRLALYFNALEKLRAQNRLFACRKSRSELAAFGGHYPLEFRTQDCSLDDQDVAWRIKSDLPDGNDFVLRRRDGLPAYQVASLVDDLHYGISHVIRGEDLEASTASQCFLAACLKESKFLNIQFLHHPLLLDRVGNKLSKSAGSDSLKAIRASGGTPAVVFGKVAELLGLKDVSSASELLEVAGSAYR